MAFGPEIFVDRPDRDPIRLAGFDVPDLKQFPPIGPAGLPGVAEFVTEEFVREAKTFQENDPNYLAYYNELKKDEESSTWWGIWAGDRLVGFTGWRDKTTDVETDVTSAKTRTVIMNPDYFSQGIGRAAALGRLLYATQYEGINHLTANIDLNNIRSYEIVRSLGSACIQDKIMPEDPTRHQMRLWHSTPERPIDFSRLQRPLHGDSWSDTTNRLQATLEIARHRVHLS